MKIIRWPGFIAFIAISAAIAGSWLLLVDGMIERGIEYTGTKMLGAKVELSSADLSLSPLGLTLSGLELTDPDEPMKNMVEVKRTAFLLDPGHLLLGKVIVNEMTMDGVRTGTDRKYSGEVKKKPASGTSENKKAQSKETFSFPSLEIPDPKEILAKEELETLKLAEAIKSDIKNAKSDWKTRIDALPDSGKIKEYKARFDDAKKGLKGGISGILGGAGELKALKADIKKDIDNVKTAKKDLKKEIDGLKNRIEQVKATPKDDLNRLQEKYTLSPGGLSNFSRLLFSAQITAWTDKGFAWYEKAEPFIKKAMEEKPAAPGEVKPERRKGIDMRFKEFNPMPDYLVKVASLSVNVPVGDIKGEVKEISSDQGIRKKPLTFNFSGDKLKGIGRMDIDGEVNRVSPSSSRDKADIKISGYRIENAALSEGSDFPLSIGSADADFNASTVLKGGVAHAELTGKFNKVSLTGGEHAGGGQLKKSLYEELSDIKGFGLKVVMNGSRGDYDMKVSSNLDEILKNALGSIVRKESERFKEKLSAAISDKIKAPLDSLGGDLGGLDILDKALSSKSAELEALLSGTTSDGGKKSGLKGLLPF